MCESKKSLSQTVSEIKRDVAGTAGKGIYKDHVVINNSARTYEEQLAQYEAKRQGFGTQNITIGSNNKIKNSTIAGIINTDGADAQKGFYERHPVFCSLLISFVAGIILLFSFGEQVISFIEGLF